MNYATFGDVNEYILLLELFVVSFLGGCRMPVLFFGGTVYFGFSYIVDRFLIIYVCDSSTSIDDSSGSDSRGEIFSTIYDIIALNIIGFVLADLIITASTAHIGAGQLAFYIVLLIVVCVISGIGWGFDGLFFIRKLVYRALRLFKKQAAFRLQYHRSSISIDQEMEAKLLSYEEKGSASSVQMSQLMKIKNEVDLTTFEEKLIFENMQALEKLDSAAVSAALGASIDSLAKFYQHPIMRKVHLVPLSKVELDKNYDSLQAKAVEQIRFHKIGVIVCSVIFIVCSFALVISISLITAIGQKYQLICMLGSAPFLFIASLLGFYAAICESKPATRFFGILSIVFIIMHFSSTIILGILEIVLPQYFSNLFTPDVLLLDLLVVTVVMAPSLYFSESFYQAMIHRVTLLNRMQSPIYIKKNSESTK